MIKDITIGQYYPAESILHKLDPRVKILLTFLYVILLFTFDNWKVYLIFTAVLCAVIKISSVPIGYILRGLKPLVFILLFTVAMNVMFTKGEHILFTWGFITISVEGIVNAAFFSLRMIYLVIGSSIMTFTTSPNAMTDGLEAVLKPLKIIKAPVSEIAMMMSIALRFIPIFVDETDKITKAQMSRGADFETGNLIKRLKNMLPLLVPLFISAFRRATDLAQAMEARCYVGGEGRTKMKPLIYSKRDYVAYILAVAVVGIVIVTNKFI